MFDSGCSVAVIYYASGFIGAITKVDKSMNIIPAAARVVEKVKYYGYL